MNKLVKVYNDKNELISSYETTKEVDFITTFERPNRVEVEELQINETLIYLLHKTAPKHVSGTFESNNFFVQYDSPSMDQKLITRLISLANVFGYRIEIRKAVYMTVDFIRKTCEK